MNANALIFNDMYRNTLMEQANRERLARLAQNTSGLRQRLLRPMGQRLIVLGQRLMADNQTNEDMYAEAERIAGYVS